MIVECASCRDYVEAAEHGAFEYIRHGGLWILFQSPNVVAVLQIHQIVAQDSGRVVTRRMPALFKDSATLRAYFKFPPRESLRVRIIEMFLSNAILKKIYG